MSWTETKVAELVKKLEEERDEGFALRDQWLQDSRDQTAEAWATRNRELDELWPQIHAKDAEISQLKDHTEMLMGQLEAAEAKALQLETCLHGVRDGKIQPTALKESLTDLLKRALAFKSS